MTKNIKQRIKPKDIDKLLRRYWNKIYEFDKLNDEELSKLFVKKGMRIIDRRALYHSYSRKTKTNNKYGCENIDNE